MGDYNEVVMGPGGAVIPGTAMATATTTTTTSTVEDIDLAAATDAYGNYYPPSASHYHHHYQPQQQQQQQPQYMVQYGTVPAQQQQQQQQQDMMNGAPPSTGNSSSSIAGGGNNADGTRWRNPNLVEVIQFLKSPNNVIKANAAAYLQHLCYMDDPNKQKTRQLGGILPLIELAAKNDNFMVYRNALGALRNLSYGRQNDENKRQIKNYNGITELMALLVKLNGRMAAAAAVYDEDGGGGGGGGGGGRKQTLTPVMEMEIKELITGIIWNMSSCEDIKRTIIDDSVDALVQMIIIPYSGILSPNGGQVAQIFASSSTGTAAGGGNNPPNADNYLATVFRNATGIIRNISSAGEYARQKLRETPLLIQTLVHIIKCGIDRQNIGNKIIENCVCILRNLSYRLQEIEDPNYDKMPIPLSNITGTASTSGEFLNATGGAANSNNGAAGGGGGGGVSSAAGGGSSSGGGGHLGCFGVSKKKKQANKEKEAAAAAAAQAAKEEKSRIEGGGGGGAAIGGGGSNGGGDRNGGGNGNKNYELLFQPEVIQFYLQLLQSCSNPETLEAAAGAIQNLAACYWQPSIEIRAAVRKEKGLPILVELLRMEVDRVVCAVATSLRNLAIDQRNKELIGKYAMRDLIQKLPTGNVSHDQGTSDDTIAAVLATLNEVIKKNCEFCRSLLDNGGVERLMIIVKQKKQNYTPRVLKFTGQLLYTMWQHQDLRDAYKKCGWKESDFVYLQQQQQTMMMGGGSGSGSATNTLSKSKIGGGGGGSANSSASNTLSLHHQQQQQQSPNSPPGMGQQQQGGGGVYGVSGGGQMQMGMNTLSRPMASQGGTRYEDRTIKRNGGGGGASQARSISVAGSNSNYSTLQHQQRNGGLSVS